MKKVILILGFIAMISFISCEEIDTQSPIETNFIDYHYKNNEIFELRVTVQNNTEDIIYYLKCRLELQKNGKNVSSDVYEFGSKTNKKYWNVEPNDATSTPWASCSIIYDEDEKDDYKWYVTEMIEYLSY